MATETAASLWTRIIGWRDGRSGSTLLPKGRVGVLRYHGVVEQRRDGRLERNLHSLDEFRAQAEFLKTNPVLALAELAQALRAGQIGEHSGVVLTFDDGYRNNLECYKILAGLGLPFTIFVTVGALEEGRCIWTVELSLLLLHGQAAAVEVFGQRWELSSRQAREAAFQTIRVRMKSLRAGDRKEKSAELRAQFPPGETQRLLQAYPSLAMLSWEEVRHLSDAGIEIGSHGVDHEIHHPTQDPAARERELKESKQEIERQLGKPCRFFAFPNGNVCEDSPRELVEAGYELGLRMEGGLVGPGSNPFLLPGISPRDSAAKLKQQLKALR